MDWSNERYVRLYVRDTVTWQLLPWQARATFALLIRKVDRAGVLDVGRHGPRGVAAAVQMPEEVVLPGVEALVAEGVLELGEGCYVIPNFIEAQEAEQSDRQRQRESRGRRRDVARARGASPEEARAAARPDRRPRDVESQDVTAGSRNVTEGHVGSQRVTLSLAVDQEAPADVVDRPRPLPELLPLPAAIERSSGDQKRAHVSAEGEGERRSHDARREAVDAIWAEQEAGIDELQAAGIDRTAGRLGLVNGAAKLQLANRLGERAADGRGYEAAMADCRHVLTVLFREAKASRSLRYLRGQHWEPKNFERALASSPEDVVQRVRERQAFERRLAAKNPELVAPPRPEPPVKREPPPPPVPPEELAAIHAEKLKELGWVASAPHPTKRAAGNGGRT